MSLWSVSEADTPGQRVLKYAANFLQPHKGCTSTDEACKPNVFENPTGSKEQGKVMRQEVCA